ncbi:hypothetical protein B0J11DRAFT_584865 [Dendryphion nanum]|uniref:Uncharacterized protein n=1 Tax=Dendryphion nanum TaxID=256645 RepID=A0A9P9D835_9PLEO|nr:hypothetical protein B0J11DRAFT_584865 [Dendryphion nanum]
MAFGCAAHASANVNAIEDAHANLLQERDGPTPTVPPTVFPTDPIRMSVLSVIITAIPPTQLSKALNDEAAFSSEIASSLSAGKTPEWFLALPSDVKSLLPSLYPAQAAALTAPATTAAATSSATSAASATQVPAQVSTAAVVSTSSKGAAARPTGVVGAGIAGAIGVLGMLVL